MPVQAMIPDVDQPVPDRSNRDTPTVVAQVDEVKIVTADVARRMRLPIDLQSGDRRWFLWQQHLLNILGVAQILLQSLQSLFILIEASVFDDL